jgi:hypothetical protein
LAFPLARVGSDHIPIHIQIGTHISKAQLFGFENFWYEFDGFMDTMTESWNSSRYKQDSALALNTKFKFMRSAMKKWTKNISNLNIVISNCNYSFVVLDCLEERRVMSTMEKKFRRILKSTQKNY